MAPDAVVGIAFGAARLGWERPKCAQNLAAAEVLTNVIVARVALPIRDVRPTYSFGDTFEDASDSCSTPCESRSSKDCPGEQSCSAFVTDCVSVANPFSPTSQPVSQSYSFGIANTQWDLDAAAPEEDVGSVESSMSEEHPNWYNKWDGEDNSSTSLIVLLVSASSFSLLLSAAL